MAALLAVAAVGVPEADRSAAPTAPPAQAPETVVVVPATPGADGDVPPTAEAPPRMIIEHTQDGGRIAIVPVSSVNGIPSTVLAAYQRATAAAAGQLAGCHLPMTLLAAIGKVESGHARGGQVDVGGTTMTPILGPALNGGPGVAAIGDTDGGRLDGDTRWDRAVGPMQFIPGTWARSRVDGNGDGIARPHNVFDATAAAAGYLCAGGRDLATPAGLRAGILSYNRSESYLGLVLAWMAAYSAGATAIPNGTPARVGTPAEQQPGAPADPVTGPAPTWPAPTQPAPGDPILPTPTAPPTSGTPTPQPGPPPGTQPPGTPAPSRPGLPIPTIPTDPPGLLTPVLCIVDLLLGTVICPNPTLPAPLAPATPAPTSTPVPGP